MERDETGTDPRLRAGRPADASTIATIWHDGWRDGHLGHVPDELLPERTPETFLARTRRRLEAAADATTVVLDLGSPAQPEVAGFVMIVDDELEQIYVDARHRGSGLADVLIGEAERLIAGAGHDHAWLAVVAGNLRARSFYAKRGWRDDGAFVYRATVSDGLVDVPSHRYVKRVAEARL